MQLNPLGQGQWTANSPWKGDVYHYRMPLVIVVPFLRDVHGAPSAELARPASSGPVKTLHHLRLIVCFSEIVDQYCDLNEPVRSTALCSSLLLSRGIGCEPTAGWVNNLCLRP